MNSDFRIINDAKWDFIKDITLREHILKAGRKKIVFVEGCDDKVIFEILYEDYSDKLFFIDASMKADVTTDPNIIGGCETVKYLLKVFVSNLHNDKRFYGVIDRDMKKDEEILSEKSRPCYDGRLFIFSERYTLENYYFTEADILCEFLHGQSINHAKLLPLLSDKDKFEKYITDIVNEISKCLTEIGAANLTIRLFDNSVSFLEPTIGCTEIEDRLIRHRLKKFSEDDVKCKFDDFKTFIEQSNGTQKFASAKTYFSYQFNQHLGKKGVNIQLNNHKSELAHILSKNYALSGDFIALLSCLKIEMKSQ